MGTCTIGPSGHKNTVGLYRFKLRARVRQSPPVSRAWIMHGQKSLHKESVHVAAGVSTDFLNVRTRSEVGRNPLGFDDQKSIRKESVHVAAGVSTDFLNVRTRKVEIWALTTKNPSGFY